MSGGRGTFDGQHWREELLRKRTKEALERYNCRRKYVGSAEVSTSQGNQRHSRFMGGRRAVF